MKLVLAHQGIRAIANCLWSVLVLAQLYTIDLEQVFLQTMNELEQHLRERWASPSSGAGVLRGALPASALDDA